jgi:DNA invertase Pin-like site-specific DNA recombinase
MTANVTRRTGAVSNTLAGIPDVDGAIAYALKHHVWRGPAWGDPEGRLLYGRKSNDELGDPVNVDAQLHEWVQACDADGVPVAGIFADAKIGASEYTSKPRPGFDAMVEAVATANGRYVCMYNLDRLTRRNDQLDLLIARRAVLCQAKGKALDLADPDDQFHARLIVSMAQREAQVVHRRVTRTQRQLRANGVPHNNHFGFGFRGGEVYEPEAKIVREMVERFLAGASLRDIGTWLRDSGVVGLRGSSRWEVMQVQKILATPRIAGYFQADGDLVQRRDFDPARHAIIDLETSERVNALLASRGERARGFGSRTRNEWSGLIRCGGCGGVMEHSSKGRRTDEGYRRVYRCAQKNGCGGVSIGADETRQLLLDLVFDRVDEGKVSAMLRSRSTESTKAETRALVTEIRHLERDLAAVADLVGPDGYTPAQGAKLSRNYRAALDAKRAALRELSPENDGPLAEYLGQRGALSRAWPDLSTDQRHAIIEGAITAAFVMPAAQSRPYFQPERVTIADQLSPKHRLLAVVGRAS